MQHSTAADGGEKTRDPSPPLSVRLRVRGQALPDALLRRGQLRFRRRAAARLLQRQGRAQERIGVPVSRLVGPVQFPDPGAGRGVQRAAEAAQAQAEADYQAYLQAQAAAEAAAEGTDSGEDTA